MEGRTHKWFVEQYNRNRPFKEWVKSFEQIKIKSNGKKSNLEMGR